MAEKDGSPGSTSTIDQFIEKNHQFISCLISEIIRNPINLVLVSVISILVYKIVKMKRKVPVKEIKTLPKLRRDFTVQELKQYNGTGPDQRILIAVNGNIYDCTRAALFYGPGRS